MSSASKNRLPLDQVKDLVVRQNLQIADERLAALENVTAVTVPITDWVAYTPTVTNGPSVVTLTKCFWRRVGDSIEVKGTASMGAHDGNGAVFELAVIPHGLTVDSTKICADEIGPCGTMRYFRSGTGSYPGITIQRSTGTIVFQPSYTVNAFIASLLQTSDTVSWHATIPILEYA